MKLQIALCDDNARDLQILSSLLESYSISSEQDLKISSFDNVEQLLLAYQALEDYNIFFLDIEMPILDGLQVAKIIREKSMAKAIIIFISNYPKYMQDSFSVHPYYFLQKPITREQIFSLMDEIRTDYLESHRFFSVINHFGKDETIILQDILYIECLKYKKEELCFHTVSKEILTKGLISYWEERLSEYGFISCYRGILVNLLHIHYFDHDEIVLDNGKKLPLSRKNKKVIHSAYLNNIIITRKL